MTFTLVDKAIAFSAKAHDGQLRKASDVPYISHPMSVGMLLMKAACSDEVVSAGLLHDTLEDTEVTEEMIESEFGTYVLNLVKEASEPDKSLSWKERKQHTIQHLGTASIEACYVIAADKLHNLRSIRLDIENSGEDIWKKFNKGKDDQAWYYGEIARGLETRLGRNILVQSMFLEFNEIF